MTDKTSWSRYIDATSGSDLNNVIARRISVDPATIGRWRAGTVEPKPRQVIEYARAYKQSPLGALIAAGYIDAEELDLKIVVPSASVRDFSEEDLAEELLRRIRSRPVGGASDTEDLHSIDLRDEVDLAATDDATHVDPSRGEA